MVGGGSVQRSVGALLVVVLAEQVELVLQGGEVGCCGAGGEPALQGLVEPFDLALGLRVSGRAVLLADTEDRQQVLKRVSAAAEPGCVDPAVVGQCAGRRTVRSIVSRKVATTVSPVTGWWAVKDKRNRE